MNAKSEGSGFVRERRRDRVPGLICRAWAIMSPADRAQVERAWRTGGGLDEQLPLFVAAYRNNDLHELYRDGYNATPEQVRAAVAFVSAHVAQLDAVGRNLIVPGTPAEGA